jgi:hypothetical protein
VGAKVFLLQASTSGYGTKSTSLLTSAAGGTDTTLVGSTGTPAYYTTTDLAGDFNITGDYTCTAGLPVYVYAVGGSPDVNPAVGNSSLQSASGDGTTTTFTVDTEKMYVGQQVLISGIQAGNPFYSLNGTQTVTAVSGTGNTSFSVASSVSAPATNLGNVATASPLGTVNPAITNVAVLGNCPSSAPYNFATGSSDPIQFVYMNEVSTVAAMYALAPFAETSTISGGVVTRTGTDAQHIGIPPGDTLALTGIQNAAVNAGQLYDITGASNQNSTADGEGHIARSVVPNSGKGYGVATVPQALIDTLGNILAACVDSANTYGLGATTGTASPACENLFLNATSNGIPVTSLGSTTPMDTATAAINIAHYPAGNGASAGSFVNNLFTIPTGVVPFSPNLGSNQPKDFMIGINITVPQGTNPTNYLGTSAGGTPVNAIPTAIAAASTGEVFVGTTGCGSGGVESATNGYGCVLQIEPTQLLPALPTVGGVGLAQGVRSIALGPSGKVWATGVLETGQTVNGFTPPAGAFYIVVNTPGPSAPLVTGASSTAESFAAYGNSSLGTGIYTAYYGNPTGIAVNGNARAYISDSTKNYLHDITSENTTPNYTITNTDVEYLLQSSTLATTNCTQAASAVAIGALTPANTANGSGAYNVWVTSPSGGATQGMCVIPDQTSLSGTYEVESNTPTVYTVTPVAAAGAQYTPTSVAVDANDVGWDTNQSPGIPLNQTGEGFANNGNPSGMAFGGEFLFARSQTTTPSGIAIDGNNNLWITNTGSNSVSVYTNGGVPIGLANPNPVRISPAGTGNNDGGYLAGSTMSGPAAIAIDPSGDVWVANTTTSATGGTAVGYSVTELIGAAAPTYTGLAAARAANKLGAKP